MGIALIINITLFQHLCRYKYAILLAITPCIKYNIKNYCTINKSFLVM
jgi:hypothetical protein